MDCQLKRILAGRPHWTTKSHVIKTVFPTGPKTNSTKCTFPFPLIHFVASAANIFSI